MPAYFYDTKQRKTQNRRHRFRRLFLVLGLLLLLFITGGIVFIWQTSQPSRNHPVVLKSPSKSFYNGSPRRVYENERFRFESAVDWQLSREESLGTIKYVFFKHNKNLIDYELDILFDKSLAGQAVNYVMPVTVVGGKMKTDIISGRCGDEIIQKTGPTNAPNTMALQYKGAAYTCAVRGAGEKAAAALVGGGYDITLTGPKSGPTIVNFSFNNHSSSYFAGSFKEVLESFTLK